MTSSSPTPLPLVPGSKHPSTNSDVVTQTHASRFNPLESSITQELLAPVLRPAPVPRWPGFVVQRELGRGGMGVVYQAQQTALNRTVALKTILPRRETSSADLHRFLAEAEAIAQLTHPNIVQIHEMGQLNGVPYFALEFCDGGSLERIIRDEPQPAAFTARLVEQLADALNAVHARQIIHRDLKPDNVLLQRLPEWAQNPHAVVPKITDFGLARHGDAQLTQSGFVVGTPAYMAPEQAQGQQSQVGPRADIWALGAILYRMLTGRVPFKGATLPETLQLVVVADPVPIRALVPNCPRDLETIALKCLQKDPQQRYASAQELRADLRAWQEGRPIRARPTGVGERLAKWARRQPLAAGLAIALLFGVLAVIFSWWRAEQSAEVARNLAVQADQSAEAARVQAERATRSEAEARTQLAKAQARGLESRRIVRESLIAISNELRAFAQDARPAQAKLLAKAKGFYEQFEREHEDSPELRLELAQTLVILALVARETGEVDQALGYYQRGRELLTQLCVEQPDRAEHLRELALLLLNLGGLHLLNGQYVPARQTWAAALIRFKELLQTEPTNLDLRCELAKLHSQLGHLNFQEQRFESADTEWTLAQHQLQMVLTQQPQNVEALQTLGRLCHNWGVMHRRLGLRPQAQNDFQHAVEHFRAGLEVRSADVELLGDVANSLSHLGVVQFELNQLSAAENTLTAARTQAERVIGLQPSVTEHREMLSRLLNTLGQVYRAQKRGSAADHAQQQASELLDEILRQQPHSVSAACAWIVVQTNRASSQMERRQFTVALERFQALQPRVDEFQKRHSHHAELRELVGGYHVNSAECCLALERYPEALAQWQRAQHCAPEQDQVYLRLRAAQTQVRSGQVAAARTVVAELDRPTLKVFERYELVRVLGLLLAHQPDETLALRAVEQMRQAIAGGWNSRQMFTTEPDLAALRQRADFQALAQKLPQ